MATIQCRLTGKRDSALARRRYSAGEGIHDATAGSVYGVSNRPPYSLCGAEDGNVLLMLGDQMRHRILVLPARCNCQALGFTLSATDQFGGLGRRNDRYVLVPATQAEQMLVAGDDQFGICLQGAGEYLIVVSVIRHHTWHSDQPHPRPFARRVRQQLPRRFPLR